MSYAKRIDANQNEIVETFRKMGCKVSITSSLGKGFPDVIVKVGRNIYMIQIKNGDKPPSQQKLTPAEEKFHREWGCVHIINSVERAIDFVNELRC